MERAAVQTLLSQPLQQLLSCNLESIDAGGANQRPGLHSPEGLPVRHYVPVSIQAVHAEQNGSSWQK